MVILEPLKSKCYSISQPFGIWLFGTLVSATGMILMGSSGLTTLTCQRLPTPSALPGDGICTVAVDRLLAPSSQEITLGELQEARVEKLYRHQYHVSYQVILMTQSGGIPITNASPTERDWKAEITTNINQFLETPKQDKLTIPLENQSWTEGVGFFLAAIGTGAGLFARQITREIRSLQDSTP